MISTVPQDVSIEVNTTTVDDWHPLGDLLWLLPATNECVLAHYIDGPVVTVNCNYLRNSAKHFDKWRPIPKPLTN
jgi:hypothetical protein